MIVATPDIITARLASRPITRGKTNVAPNIAITCWAPKPTMRGHDSRSSGLTTSPGESFLPSPCTFQPSAITPLPNLRLRLLIDVGENLRGQEDTPGRQVT
ncbi:hypothetical protein GCM10020219_076970 [Nonomuraea dietziae]